MKYFTLSRVLILAGVLACFGLPSGAAMAAATIGKIDGLVPPAWLDRNNLTVPATPATELFAGDKLRTGNGARLILRLNEGSAVQLGENAIFEIVSAQQKSQVFTAALNVLEGAFRFTTRALAKAQPRNVNIRVGNNATIGIRGTDLWGRGSVQKDIVCLIEGKIDVTGNNNVTLRLDQPLQFFQSTRNRPPEMVSFLDRKQLDIWAKETDIEVGKGTTIDGQWKIIIGDFPSRNAMLTVSRTLREAGFANDRTANNTLTISRLVGEVDAKALAAKISEQFKLSGVQVSR